MKEKFEHRLEQTVGPERVLREEPMRLHTTFRIGGPAQYMVSPRTKEEVQEVAERLELTEEQVRDILKLTGEEPEDEK